MHTPAGAAEIGFFMPMDPDPGPTSAMAGGTPGDPEVLPPPEQPARRRRGLRVVLTSARRSLAVARRVPGLGGEAGRLTELERKLRGFELFLRALRYAEGEENAGAVTRASASLEALVQGALRSGPWEALWVLEGLGYARGVEVATQGGGAPGAGIDRHWWLPLHTGLGMALGEGLLPVLRRERDPKLILRRVEAHAELCQELAAPGYALAVFEPLGFMVRMLAPHRFRAVAGSVVDWVPLLRDAFWHGAGRSRYFSPFHVSGGRALEEAWAEAQGLGQGSDRGPARNAVAGAAWAVTLVQLGQPAVVERALDFAHRRLPPELQPAMANGVASAVRLWHHAWGYESLLARFLDYRARAVGLWEDVVQRPSRQLLREARASGSPEPGALFRHAPEGPP